MTVVECLVPQDLLFDPVLPIPWLEDPGLHVQRLGRDAQRLGDLLEDVGTGLAQPSLDLAQIRVGDTGTLAKASQRQSGRAALVTDELAEVMAKTSRNAATAN